MAHTRNYDQLCAGKACMNLRLKKREIQRPMFCLIISLVAVLAAVIFSPQLWGQQSHALDPKIADTLQTAARQGFVLRAKPPCTGTVTVQAVLLPARICRRVFGKEIADNYATVVLTVSNQNHDASLIVQSVYLDLSDWLLSGGGQQDSAAQAKGNENQSRPFIAQTKRSQINSVESRIARGQLLDAQAWTRRNWVIRGLQLAGAIASGYDFSISEKGIVKGISAFNGNVIPGMESFWPDPTVGQMNRLSDLGFQVNKVIAQDSSGIIAAFFPIDLFMSPTLKKLFIKSPALFFSPIQMAMDPKMKGQVEKLLKPMFEAVPKNSQSGAEKNQQPPQTFDEFMANFYGEIRGELTDKKTTQFLNKVSFDSARVVVTGVMTVDVSGVPAVVTSIDFDGGNNNPVVWATPGEKEGVIRGSFLSGASFDILEKDQLQIKDPVVEESVSSDTQLRFKMNLTKALTGQTTLTFRISKKDKNGNTIESKEVPLAVNSTPH